MDENESNSNIVLEQRKKIKLNMTGKIQIVNNTSIAQ